jgi:hypothetical protein
VILLLLSLAPGARATRLEWRGGLELDGRRESFGFASLFDAGGIAVEGDSAAVRYRERELEVLALAGLSLRPSGLARSNGIELEARAGPTRRSLTLDGAFAEAGLTARNRFLADEDEGDDGTLRSAQNLLQMTWSPPSGSSWRPALRGACDLSWAGAGANRDTLATVNAEYLRYRRASAGLGVLHGAYGEGRLFLDVSRKWADREARGAYESFTLAAQQSTVSLTGGLDLELRAERRRYLDGVPDTLDGALTSYREAEAYARWRRTGARWGWEAGARVTGLLYDGNPVAPDTSDAAALAALTADRVQLETTCMARRPLIGDPLDVLSAAAAGRVTLECALGLVGDQLWVRESTGEYHALGVRLESTLRGGPGWGEAWLDIAVEGGRRDYRDDRDALGFDFEGLSLSLTQSDYGYLSGSLIGGGRIAYGIEWQLYAALDSEWHAVSADDARLFSLDLTLLKRWGSAR